ncbi:MAG: hypothetical protein CM15mP120_13970 [Pseudomonadota bacterium]|nr:MAG: hypothetical protein CM15mP120_13970 [Pseudomonadota bacterium]
MNPEDAKRCVDVGVDVVYVSNHGGRQLDHTLACIDALPGVVEAVDGRIPVVVDGGFMRGADVIKGLCLVLPQSVWAGLKPWQLRLAACLQCFARCRFSNGRYRYR